MLPNDGPCLNASSFASNLIFFLAFLTTPPFISHSSLGITISIGRLLIKILPVKVILLAFSLATTIREIDMSSEIFDPITLAL